MEGQARYMFACAVPTGGAFDLVGLTPWRSNARRRADINSSFAADTMTSRSYDVLAIGNAIVDIIARTDDDFLAAQALNKGSMALIDEPRAEHLYGLMGSTTIVSGGSAANTAVGLAGFGMKTAFIGKVKADPAGHAYAHDLRATGVHFDTRHADEGPATARCYVLVTPDGERTMNTYLGACQNLSVADLDEAAIASSSILYLEGYLWDPAAAKEAFVRAAEISHKAGNRVALTLSDSFCVDRYRDEFLNLLRNGTVDILFANEHELKSLYQTADFASALSALKQEKILGVVTCSENGSIVVSGDTFVRTPAQPIDKLVDTTGAGDLFAAGFLAGLCQNSDYGHCATLGALAAAEIIQHYGARPETNLRELANSSGIKI